jgi:hypothetical protein
MTSAEQYMVYYFYVGEQSYYFLDEQAANQAFTEAELRGELPMWGEPTPLATLLEIKDALLAKFTKRIAFLELQLERAEMSHLDFDLGG